MPIQDPRVSQNAINAMEKFFEYVKYNNVEMIQKYLDRIPRLIYTRDAYGNMALGILIKQLNLKTFTKVLQVINKSGFVPDFTLKNSEGKNLIKILTEQSDEFQEQFWRVFDPYINIYRDYYQTKLEELEAAEGYFCRSDVCIARTRMRDMANGEVISDEDFGYVVSFACENEFKELLKKTIASLEEQKALIVNKAFINRIFTEDDQAKHTEINNRIIELNADMDLATAVEANINEDGDGKPRGDDKADDKEGGCTIMCVHEINNNPDYSDILGIGYLPFVNSMEEQKKMNRLDKQFNNFDYKADALFEALSFDFTPQAFIPIFETSDALSIIAVPSSLEGITMEQISGYITKIANYLFDLNSDN